MSTDISVLIVTYNNERQIGPCLASLERALTGLSAEVLVQDNASTDCTVQAVREHARVRVFASSSNVGFARACNLLAERSTGRVLLFLNPDTVIHEAAVRELLAEVASRPRAGLFGARTVTPSGRTVPSAQAAMSLWSLACFATGLSTALPSTRWSNPEALPGWGRDTSREVPVLSGGALCVTREAWTRLGGFDTTYFMYGEDADLSARAWALGYRPYFVSTALVEHEVGASSSPSNKLIMLHRGKVTYLRRTWPSWKARLGVGLLLMGVWLRSSLASSGVGALHGGATPGEAWRTAWIRRNEWREGWTRSDQ